MPNRKKLSRSEVGALRAYYGKKCVVDATENDIDWHHLDDNPSNSTFVNIVPLRRDYNLRLKQYSAAYNGKSVFFIDPLLEPLPLTLTAERHLLLGRAALAVGASRLAVFLSQRYFPGDTIHPFLLVANALHYLRHCFDLRICQDVFNRNILGCWGARLKISNEERCYILFEIASLLQDFGLIKDSDILYARCEEIGIDFLSQARRAALSRRRSINSAILSNIDRARSQLSESTLYVSKLGRSITHYLSAKAKLESSAGNKAAAIDALGEARSLLLDDAGQPRQFAQTYWGTASALIIRALLVASPRDRRQRETAREDLMLAHRMLTSSGAKLSPVTLGIGEMQRELEKARTYLRISPLAFPMVAKQDVLSLKPLIRRVVNKFW